MRRTVGLGRAHAVAALVVIGERFAWAHLPKTAGDATALMFAAAPGLVQFADPPDSDDKHLPFFAREAEVEGRLLVMNIRRLPIWILSGAHHKATHGVYPEYRPLPLESLEEMSSRTEADDLLRWMTDHGRFVVSRWLRAEMLEHDLLALLSELGVLTPSVAERVRAVGRVNVGSYDPRTEQRFSDTQIARMYALNPGWAAIEERVYGERARSEGERGVFLGDSRGPEEPVLDRETGIRHRGI